MPVSQVDAVESPPQQSGIGGAVASGAGILLVCGVMVLQRYLFDGDALSQAGQELLRFWQPRG